MCRKTIHISLVVSLYHHGFSKCYHDFPNAFIACTWLDIHDISDLHCNLNLTSWYSRNAHLLLNTAFCSIIFLWYNSVHFHKTHNHKVCFNKFFKAYFSSSDMLLHVIDRFITECSNIVPELIFSKDGLVVKWLDLLDLIRDP